jgi:hypothetical protein
MPNTPAFAMNPLLIVEENQATVNNRNQCHRNDSSRVWFRLFFLHFMTYHFACRILVLVLMNDTCSCFDVHSALEYYLISLPSRR